MRIKKLAAPALLAFLSLATSALAQEDYSTWSGHENIIINTKISGAGIATNQYKYPVLVRLDSANASAVFSAALAGGVDIRFGKTSGAKLAFERERWDAAAKKAEFWVLLDTVRGNDSSIAFRMHWGKPGVADSSKGSAVFSAANGFLAVWHMNQTITAPGDSVVDATGNGHRGTVALEGAGAVPANITTGIGIGKNFLGAFDAGNTITFGAYFLVSNADNGLNLNTTTGPFTLSAWANPAICDVTARMGLLTKYANVNTAPTAGRAYALQTSNVNGNWRLTVDPLSFAGASTTAVVSEFAADTYCVPEEWTYLAGSYDAGGTPPTADGSSASSTTSISRFGAVGTETTTGITVSQQPASIGNNANVYIGRIHNLDRFFRGGVDEVRISNVRRSDDWNKLDYELQRGGSKIVYVGTPPASVHSGDRAALGFSMRSTGSAVRFQLPAGFAGRVSIADLSGREVWSRRVDAGMREMVWEGVSARGSRATPGSYIARVTHDGASSAAAESKVVLLR